jgi:hypothetical protein
MARQQTESGGFSQSPASSYPVYALISNDAFSVSATLNTGPSFAAPEDYGDWSTGAHIVVFPDGSEMTASVNDEPVIVHTFILGKQVTVSVGDVSVLLSVHNVYPVGVGMTVTAGHMRSTNWSKVTEAASTKEHWIKV